MRSYTSFYKALIDSNKRLRYWSDFDTIWTPDCIVDLERVYERPSDVDLFVGGLCEKPVNGGLTGKVFQKIKADQFKKLKEGDRFFFTHRRGRGLTDATKFSRGQIEEIMKRTMSCIICDNTEIQLLPKNVFQSGQTKFTCPDILKECTLDVSKFA